MKLKKNIYIKNAKTVKNIKKSKVQKNSPGPSISTKKQNRVKQQKYKNLKNAKYANRCKKC